jgi:hypothetical protein
MLDAEHQDVVVLFVHGIGDQSATATLREFGLPLIESTGDWLGANSVTSSDVTAPVGQAPAHVQVTVRDGDRSLRVLAAESWWAPLVEPPGYGRLLRWLVSVVPFLVQRVADVGTRRSTNRMDASGERARECGLRQKVTHLGTLIVFGTWRLVQNVAALTVTLLVMAGLILVGLLTFTNASRERVLAPAGATKLRPLRLVERLIAIRLPRWVRDILIRYIGDSYALLNSDENAGAMVRRVTADLRWLEEREPEARVVIVAHSQGAELARRVVKERPPGKPVDSLITFGSGIQKLDALDQLRGRLRLASSAFGLRIVSAAGLVLSLAALAGSGPLVGSLPSWTPALGISIAFAAMAGARKLLVTAVHDYDRDRLAVTEQQVARWLDLYASHDLVSEGELPLGPLGTSKKIINRRSLLFDHVTYPQNVEAFRAAVALELARVAAWPNVTTQLPQPVATAVEARDKRVRWLVGAHATIAVGGLSVAAFLARDLGEWIAHVLGGVDTSIETFMLRGWWATAIACLVVAVAAAGLALLGSRIWSAWSHGATRRLLTARST